MLQKSSISKTLEMFFQFPTKDHYLMDISRTINVAHTSVKTNLKILLKEGVIQEHVEKRGSRKFPMFKANLDNKLFRKYKQIYNFTIFNESGIIEFIEQKLTPNAIVLFGSYQRGEDLENSDIDIFVECKKEELDLKNFEKKFKRKIQVHFKEKFSSYPKELKNNIINGVVVYGFLEGYK